MGGPCLTGEEKQRAVAGYRKRKRLADAVRESGRSYQVVTDYLLKLGLHKADRRGSVTREFARVSPLDFREDNLDLPSWK